MLAMKYENMMIEDEKRDGVDNGGSSFAILADQAKEQDYAINTYKGSGEMSDMLDSMSADAKVKEQQKNEKRILDAALKTAGPEKE